MSISRLVRSLATLDEPPVDLDEVVRWIKDNGFKPEIRFRPTQRFIKLGGVYERNILDGSNADVVDIWFNNTLPPFWDHLICCKELLHVFDSDEASISTKKDADSLIKSVGAFSLEQNLEQAATFVGRDLGNLILALVVLVPMHLLLRYESPYHSEKLSINEISVCFKIPAEWIGLVFNNFFKQLAYKVLE